MNLVRRNTGPWSYIVGIIALVIVYAIVGHHPALVMKSMIYVIVFAVLIFGAFWLLRSLIRRTVTLSWLLLAGIVLVAIVLGGLFRLVPNFSLAGLFGWWTVKGFWAGLVLLVGLAVSWVLGRWQRR